MGRLLRQENGMDLEATEMAIRAGMHEMGGVVLERLLNGGPVGNQSGGVKCSGSHTASLVDYRSKEITTVVGNVTIRRAYYQCVECGEGVLPVDEELDIAGTTFSPGVRRMMGRVGGKESFNEGREDLEELAGIKVKTKAVERVAESIGEQIERWGRLERAELMTEKVVPLKAVPKLYISFDGTGVPVIRRETAGRRGKSESGEAHTREAKLGCVFTQTGVDEKGRPQRDEASTTYVGAIEPSQAFGWRLYSEALRRGLRRAAQVIILGDGAQWIWGIADEHFPGATQIVDLYHAREHLADLSKLIYGIGSSKAKLWGTARLAQLDKGDVESILGSLRRLRPTAQQAQTVLRQTINYFENNIERMRYAEFRRQQLFVGSGVIEAGCKTIVGQRLKLSGMRWSLRGANAIIALRCSDLSGRWEEFWQARAAG